jgi:hypothetical protein
MMLLGCVSRHGTSMCALQALQHVHVAVLMLLCCAKLSILLLSSSDIQHQQVLPPKLYSPNDPPTVAELDLLSHLVGLLL